MISDAVYEHAIAERDAARAESERLGRCLDREETMGSNGLARERALNARVAELEAQHVSVMQSVAVMNRERGVALARVAELEQALREILEQYAIHGRHLYAGTSETLIVPVFDRARAALGGPVRNPSTEEGT